MTNSTPLDKKITLLSLQKMKAEGKKFTCVSLYDATTSKLVEAHGVETVLVGDSLGMTIQGHKDTLPVTMEHMLYHTAAVARGNDKALLIADLPFMAYATQEQTLKNSAALMQAGAHMVKLEGGEWVAESVKQLSDRGIPVCAHLGLTPQSVNKFGGFRVQGKQDAQAQKILEDAKILEAAGADLLVLECIPTALAKSITETLNIATIGIGAGKDTDAQVLVINDIIGITPQPPKFSKNYLKDAEGVGAAIQHFVDEVRAGEFPTEEHWFL